MTSDTARPPTISERLSDHIVDLGYEDLPTAVLEQAKHLICYHMGAALRGAVRGEQNKLGVAGAQRAQQAVQVAFKLSGAGGGCTIVGERRRADPLEAVFANASLMNGLDDMFPPSGDPPSAGAHPGLMVQPVAWAVGETVRATGREILTAVVAGYDTIGRLGWSMLPWSHAWPRRGLVLGPFGGAAAAAKLLHLSREQTAHALGHAGQAAMGVVEGSEYLWTLKPLLARSGLMAAVLAEAGMPAALTIVEGQYGIYRTFFAEDAPASLDESLATLGQEFDIANAQTTWGNRISSTPTELVKQLVVEHTLTPDSVASVNVTLPQAQEPRHEMREHALVGPEPNSMGRRGSLRFRVATTIADGHVSETRLEEPPAPDILGLLTRVRLRFENNLPSIRYARVEITTTDGGRYTAEGDGQDPPPIDATEWLEESGRSILAEDQLSRLPGLIQKLEDITDVAAVMTCLVGKEPA